MTAPNHTIKVFIENEAGSSIKNTYDEKTLELIGSAEVARPYPYPYGFVLDTLSGDGDCVDCFVVTEKALRSGDMVACSPVHLLQQHERPCRRSRRRCGFRTDDHSRLHHLGVFAHTGKKDAAGVTSRCGGGRTLCSRVPRRHGHARHWGATGFGLDLTEGEQGPSHAGSSSPSARR
jgi:hypothetical protein